MNTGFDLEEFPTSESAKRQLSYVTKGFYDTSYIGKWIYQVMGLEYDEAKRIVEELPLQFFPETATWGLKYHEIKWQLPIRENLSYEERRRLIYQKRDAKAPMTPCHMEQYLTRQQDFRVRVKDCHDNDGEDMGHPNIFHVIFSGEGTVNTKLARKLLNQIKQSHTTYLIYDRMEVFLQQIIEAEARFAVRTDFFPRYNLPFLMYDGTVRYNGRYQYNGWKTETLIDLYPTKLSILVDTKPKIYFLPQIKFKEIMVSQPVTEKDIRLACKLWTKPEIKAKEHLKIQYQSEAEVPQYNINLTVGYHLTRYNGEYRYNGTRKHESRIYQELV